MIVIQGCYTLIIDGERIPLQAGQQYLIPRGMLHGGEVLAGTRTIEPSTHLAVTGQIAYRNSRVPRGLPQILRSKSAKL